MIGGMLIKSGYATKLERCKAPFEFAPGLNILFGPNGCGKSTVLKILGAYCGINTARKECGWTKLQEPMDLWKSGAKLKDRTLPENFKRLSPGGCEAAIDWDGSPTLLVDPVITDNTTYTHFYDSKSDSPDGMTDMMSQIGMMKNTLSTGQMRLIKLKQLADATKKPPVLTEMPKCQGRGSFNDTWKRSYQSQIDYYKSLPRDGGMTVLLDEIDRCLGIHNQMLFWKNYIPNLVKAGFQVIIASHSPFALSSKNAKWVEFEPGYYENSREALKALSE